MISLQDTTGWQYSEYKLEMSEMFKEAIVKIIYALGFYFMDYN